MPPLRLLQPSEVRSSQRPWIDWASQASRGGQNTIRVCCPSCEEWRRVVVGNLRFSIRKGWWTGLCRGCHNRRIGREKPGMLGRRGAYHPSWRGGRSITSRGYILRSLSTFEEWEQEIQRPMAYDTNGALQIMEHRAVMAIALGRPLKSDEHVHHLPPGDRSDNRFENLQLVDHHNRPICLRCGWRMDDLAMGA